MRRIQFTEDEIVQLSMDRLHHHPIVRRRMMTLYLKAIGYRHKDICNELKISSMTLRAHLDIYIKEGIDGLRRLGYKGRPTELNQNRDIIITHLETSPPASLKEAKARIENLIGIKRSLPQIREFLKKNRIIRKKDKQIPEKANLAVQKYLCI